MPHRRHPTLIPVAVAFALLLAGNHAAGAPAAEKAAPSSNEAAPESPPPDPLAALLAKLTSDPKFADVRLAAHVVDAASGKVLLAANETAPMTPASTMKLATTAAALHVLGPDFKLRTIIGTLGDDLAILGGGDPNLSGRFYNDDITAAPKRWAAVLKGRGITGVKGDLVFDDSLFADERTHPNWPPKDYLEWHTAPVGALVLNDSCIELRISPGDKDGDAAKVKVLPTTEYVTLVGQIMTRAKSGNHLQIDRPRGSERFQLQGNVPLKSGTQTYFRTVHDPGMFAATVIRETLEAEGISIAGKVIRRRLWTDAWRLPEGFEALVVHSSTLGQSVAVANTNSQNLYAECILKVLAAHAASKDRPWPAAKGSWALGGRTVEQTLAAMNVPTDGCVFDDGSGLSRRNRLTTHMLTDLLLAMHRGEHAELWFDSLAVSGGTSGSLRNRMRDEPVRGRVHGKTGYLNDTRALAGYVRTLSGRTIVFAFLADSLPYSSYHHSAVKRWMDDTCRELVKM
ncbi:MAG: D-alanyl-D-alanine carboxypeptidase/D-alanyl-D-alanine-endopeptidase [Planctomycetes bacterium]|nr:D-alanyl-D-alanine carboxypeptidase/D-alanyl-D-alanine-endopeptidase [Planctomycetota bacterium]